jgi:hypothetical protein
LELEFRSALVRTNDLRKRDRLTPADETALIRGFNNGAAAAESATHHRGLRAAELGEIE